MEIKDPDLTPEQKEALERYARLTVDLHVSKIKLATFIAEHPIELLIGICLLMVGMWSFGFLFGITARQ